MSSITSLMFAAAFIYVASTTVNQVSAQNIISRSGWAAVPAKGTVQPLDVNPPSYVIIHHSDTPSCPNEHACKARVRSIQNYHINHNGWSDIGYNFLVGEDGNVYEGRGWEKTGAHAPSYNSRSIGICMIGDFSSSLPNQAALNAAKSLISFGVSEGYISSSYKLLGHRQVRDTDCPGNTLYNNLPNWGNWSPTP